MKSVGTIVIAVITIASLPVLAQQTNMVTRAPGTPSYFTVRDNIQKYVGTKVTWVAQEASSRSEGKHGSPDSERTRTYVFAAKDEQGEFLADNVFIFSFVGDSEDRDTPASKAKNRTPEGVRTRLIRGTVIGPVKLTDVNGKVSEVPELGDVTIDVVK